VRTLVCTTGSLPWTGAQGWLGALVAAFTVVFLTAQVQFVAPTWPPRMLTLPAWSVAAWWLMVRLIAMWATGADRASVIGELAGWFIGLGAGIAVNQGWLQQVHAVAGPRLGAGVEKMRRVAQKQEGTSQRGQPPPPSESEPEPEPEDDAPTGVTFDFEAEPQPSPADPLPALVMPKPSTRAVELPTSAPSPSHADEQPLQLLADITISARSEQTEAMPAAAPQLWSQSATPAPSSLNWLMQGKAPAAETRPSAPSAVPDSADSGDLLAALNAVIVQPLPQVAAPPLVASEHTALVASPPPAVSGPRPRPSSEVTMAYLPRDAVRTAITEALHRGVVPAQVAVAQDLGRNAAGVLHAYCNGAWQALDPKQLQAVAVGVVVHRDDPGQAPQVYLDCIHDWGDRDRPARAVRLCANAAMLQRLAPGQDSGTAFASLARELANAGAKPLPDRPVWPGPPWPRYDTLADFMRMWQRSG